MQKKTATLLVRVLVEVINAIRIEKRTAAFDTMHLVAFAEEEFGQIGAVLPGDAGD